LIITIATILSLITIIEAPSTGFAGKDSKKDLYKENGGEWKDGTCDFKTDDEAKADQFTEDVEKIEKFEDEKAVLEDDLCDDEDAETINIDICSSEDLTLGQAFAEKYNKENCEEHNGEWVEDECDFYENQMKEGLEIDENNFYNEVYEDEEEESDECKKHRLSIEDGD
jgi:hypothetical protein